MCRPDPFLSGPILAAVQAASIFPDCKTFVDLSLLVPPAECWRCWEELSQPPSEEQLRRFVASVFSAEPGEGQLEPWWPEDHQPAPALLSRLPAGAVREWASAVNGLWPLLGRRLSAEAARRPDRHTLLELSHGVIVPGGRFREAYYWDSYWVVLGLLAVDMDATARGLVSNLLECVARHGFVPNGLRKYYLNRSQPPLLTQMVAALLARLDAPPERGREGAEREGAEREGAAPALRLLREALPALDAEYGWWMRTGDGRSAVRLEADGVRAEALLNRYD